MLFRIKYFSSILFLFFAVNALSQNDTVEVNRLNELSLEFRESKSDSAILLGQRALSISEKINFDNGKITANINIGTAYFVQKKFNKALVYVQQALGLAKTSGNLKGMANAYFQLGKINRLLTNYGESLNNFYSALQIYESSHNDTKIGECYVQMGDLYLGQQNFQKALDHFLKALPLMEKRNEERRSSFYVTLGLSYSYLKKFDFAKLFFFKALKIKQSLNITEGMANIYTNMGVCSMGEKKYKEALDYHIKAAKIFEDKKDEYAMGISYTNLGDVYTKLGNLNEAASYLNMAMQLTKKINDLEGLQYVYGSLSEVYDLKNDHKQAYFYLKKFMLLKDSISNQQNQNQISDIQTKYETDKRDKEIKLLGKDKELKASVIAKQNTQRVAFITSIILLLGISFFIYRSYSIKKKDHIIISAQKEEVEKKNDTIETKQKEILDSIRYAKRIQTALITNEKYIEKSLERLIK